MIMQFPISDNTIAVVVRLPASIWANSIYLVGDFNGWNTHATPMKLGEQYWEATVHITAGSTSYYAFLIDGVQWCSEYQHATGPRPEPQMIRFLPIEVQYMQRNTPAYFG